MIHSIEARVVAQIALRALDIGRLDDADQALRLADDPAAVALVLAHALHAASGRHWQDEQAQQRLDALIGGMPGHA